MPASTPDQPQLTRGTHQPTGHDFVSGIVRGMVFWGRVTRFEAVDSEHYHDDPCPWVVLSSNKLHQRVPLVQAAPLTSQVNKASLPYRIFLPADKRIDYRILSGEHPLTKDGLVLTEQLRVFAHDRLIGNPVALIPTGVLGEIEAGIKYMLELA